MESKKAKKMTEGVKEAVKAVKERVNFIALKSGVNYMSSDMVKEIFAKLGLTEGKVVVESYEVKPVDKENADIIIHVKPTSTSDKHTADESQ